MESRRPVLLGHRGTRVVPFIPENSLAAFDCALADGCDGFEFDVRVTRDGRLVVCHDPIYHSLEIARADADQLRDLVDLASVVERYAGRAFLDVELKVPGLEVQTAAALAAHSEPGSYLVSSFLPDVLWTLHQHSQTIPLGFICERLERLGLWPELPVQYLIPHHALVTRELVDEVHAKGGRLFVWTVNAPSEMVRLARWGVDGVISDDTRLLVRTLGRHSG